MNYETTGCIENCKAFSELTMKLTLASKMASALASSTFDCTFQRLIMSCSHHQCNDGGRDNENMKVWWLHEIKFICCGQSIYLLTTVFKKYKIFMESVRMSIRSHHLPCSLNSLKSIQFTPFCDKHEVLHCQSLHQLTGEHRSALHVSQTTIKIGHFETGQGLFQNKPKQHAALGQYRPCLKYFDINELL